MKVAKSPPKKVPKPIKEFGDIQTDRDALEWLKNNEPDHYETDDLVKWFPDMFTVPEPGYFSGNDLYGISNRRSWKREYKDTEGTNWWEDNQGRFLVRKLDSDGTTTPEFDAAESLSEYPVFDDNDHSELEMETNTENWNDYGRHDLKRQIEEEANRADADTIERLMENIPNKLLDEIVYEIWSATDRYPEIEETSTNFPNILEKWDGSILELGEMFNLADHGFVVEIKLSSAAFDRNGRLLLRPQDVPTSVKGLIYDPKQPIQVDYETAICDSPYLTCTWTGPKEIEDRPGVKQLKLPDITERRRRA